MGEVSTFALVIAVATVAPAMFFGARLLVPARVSWQQSVVVSVLFAVGLIPTLVLITDGSSAFLWPLVGLGLLPYLAGMYLRERARAPDGRPLGFRRSAELSLYALTIALTAGVAVWAWRLNA